MIGIAGIASVEGMAEERLAMMTEENDECVEKKNSLSVNVINNREGL